MYVCLNYYWWCKIWIKLSTCLEAVFRELWTSFWNMRSASSFVKSSWSILPRYSISELLRSSGIPAGIISWNNTMKSIPCYGVRIHMMWAVRAIRRVRFWDLSKIDSHRVVVRVTFLNMLNPLQQKFRNCKNLSSLIPPTKQNDDSPQKKKAT